jgi:hypothetical protein
MATSARLPLCALIAGLASLTPRSVLGADGNHARLRYDMDDPRGQCPTEASFRARVVSRLGYDPFHEEAPLELRVRVVARDTGVRAEITSIQSNKPAGKRVLQDPRCDALGETLASTVALLLDPVAAQRISPSPPAEPRDDIDVIFLNGGGRIQGTVLEEDPKVGVTVRLADGTVKKVSRANIASIDYGRGGEAQGSAPAPQPLAPAPAPAAQSSSNTEPIPAQPATESVPIKPLWIAGVITLGGAYAATIVTTVGFAAGHDGAAAPIALSAFPIAGPFIITAGYDTTGALNALYVSYGLFQIVGLGALITGLAVHTTRPVLSSRGVGPPRDLAIVPTAGAKGNGLSVVGTF